MATRQSSFSKEEEDAAKREVILFQFRNMLKGHAKQFAVLLKMLLRNDPKVVKK